MSRFNRRVILLAGLLVPWTGQAAPWNTLGRAITADEIADWNIDVRPDGVGLPKGRGSVAEGQIIYDAQCAACHGTFGDSPQFVALAGGIGSLKTSTPQRTVGSKLNYATTLWDYINRAMPFNNSKSLAPNEVYAVVAYVLNLNGIVSADAVLDEISLPQVKMPNRDGFTLAHGMRSVHGKPDVHNVACMRNCAQEVKISAEIPPDFTQQMYGDIRAQFRQFTLQDQGAAPSPSTAAGAASAPELLKANGCGVCHGRDQGIVGPAFTDISKRYAAVADASAKLTAKIREGGSGVWGTAIMPPQSQISDVALATILNWIKSGAPSE
ncbi:MAG: c-type cytochrome [Gammaproteobacteria bacterium]|nr:c-type cytochrome [Gammaproteobacteria bacterium]